MQSNIVHRPTDDISIKRLIMAARKWAAFIYDKKKIILISAFSFGAVGVLLSFLLPTTYFATTSFVLENNSKSKLSSYSGLAAQLGFSVPGNAGGLFLDDDNVIAFIQSRTLISKTLRDVVEFSGKPEMLIDRYLDFTGIRADWSSNERLKSIRFNADESQSTILEDSIVTFCYMNILRENLSVGKPNDDLSIINVNMRATDELFAKHFNERLIYNVSQFYIETQIKKTRENVNILSHQVDSVRGLLDEALLGAALSSDANPNANPAYQRLRVASQKQLVDVEISKAMLTELVKNLEISRVTLRKETPLVQIIDKPVLPLEKKRLGKVKGFALGLLWGFTLATLFISLRYYLKQLDISHE